MGRKLICLPYAGAGAAPFAGLRQAAIPDFQVTVVTLPGREGRIDEPPMTSWTQVRDFLVTEVLTHVDADTVIYGHSMGALIGFELCRLAEQVGRPARAFCAAAAPGPESAGTGLSGPGVSEAQLLAGLAEITGQRGVTAMPPELVELIVPTLRADMELCDSYRVDESASVRTPLLAMYGSADETVTAAHAKEWGRRTSGPFRSARVDGGHLFVRDNPAAVVRVLRETAAAGGTGS